MSKSFKDLMTSIIGRIYPRPSQHRARTILVAYFSQSSTQERSLTLEKLGKLPRDKSLSRERARQILSKFRENDLGREVAFMQEGKVTNDPEMMDRFQDLKSLERIVQRIVG